MTSDPVAQNRIPRGVSNIDYVYMGYLANDKYVSLAPVDAAGRGVNPCVSPFFAGGAANTKVSGPVTASGRNFTVPQSTTFASDTVFAVCYSEARGTATDHTWRDSYIRMVASDVEKLRVKLSGMTVGSATFAAATTDISLQTMARSRARLLTSKSSTTSTVPSQAQVVTSQSWTLIAHSWETQPRQVLLRIILVCVTTTHATLEL